MAEDKKTTTTTAPNLLGGGSVADQLNQALNTGSATTALEGFNWNAATQTMIDKVAVPILESQDDPLGLAGIIPKVGPGHPAAAIGERVASVPKMTKANQAKLADVLATAGVIKPSSTGYTVSTLQAGLYDALKEAGESGSKSLSGYLAEKVQQGQGAVGAGTTTSPNTADEIAAGLQTIADSYKIPLSSTALQTWAAKYESKGLDATAAADEFKTQYAQPTAAGLWPSFAAQINNGTDTKTLLDPYANLAEHTLGVDPSTINWQSPQWSAALQSGVIDPTTQRPSVSTLSQFSTKLMSDPSFGYQYTQEGQNAAGSLTASILKLFGKLPNETLSTSLSGPTPDLAAT